MVNIILLVFFGSLSLFLTYLIKSVAYKHKIIDIPNERSLHNETTPKGGGLAIVICWYIGLSTLFFFGKIDRSLFLALLSGILLAIVSFIDDIIGLKPIFRLFIHFCTAIAAFYFLGTLRPLIMPGIEINYPLMIYPFAILGMVWFINLFNFMDGVDGFASIEAIIISAVLFAYSGSIVPVLLIACISGFLFWNWPKAKIFMGDVGSTQLGYILIVLGIHFHNDFKFSILNWIMLTSPFWFDATVTLYRRWRNGENLSLAHRKHAYQRLVQSGFSHGRVNLFLIAINVIIILMIILYRKRVVLQVPLYFLCLLFLYFIIRLIDKRFPFIKK